MVARELNSLDELDYLEEEERIAAKKAATAPLALLSLPSNSFLEFYAGWDVLFLVNLSGSPLPLTGTS
jgi:hypothetical protein